MKVLITLDAKGPTWQFAIELARALEHDGVTFTFAILGGPLADLQRAQLRTLLNVEFYESTFRAHSDSDVELDRAGDWLLELAERCDVDIIHLNQLGFGALSWPIRPLLHVLQAEPVSVRACQAVRGAGALVAPSRALLEAVQGACGPVSLAGVLVPGRAAAILPQADKEQMIVGAGNYDDAAADLPALTRVAARLSWPVYLLANAPMQGSASDNAHFLGELGGADRMAVLARAGIFARPARLAAFSYDVLDAALCGCALVLGDLPDLREQWDGAAAFVPPNDEESLYSTLLWLMNDADARSDFSERARQRAALFSTDKMATGYLSLYIELALRSSSRLYERISGHPPLDWSA